MNTTMKIINSIQIENGDVINVVERVTNHNPAYGGAPITQTVITWLIIHESDGEQQFVSIFDSFNNCFSQVSIAFDQYVDSVVFA